MAEPITAALARAFVPERRQEGHKGTFGHALLVAGAPGFTGAGCLAANAAARSGAGLVTLLCPAALHSIFEVKLTEVMTVPAGAPGEEVFGPGAVPQALQAAAERGAVGLGPGIGTAPSTRQFIAELLPAVSGPLVIDADGLNAIADASGRPPERASCIVTPHPGEMARLTGVPTADIQHDREGTARRWAAEWGCTVVLKGAGTIIAAPDERVWVNTTGNHGLASGGTGDVLTGLITGLLAQGCAPDAAACLGVYLHGWAADWVAAQSSPRSLVAGDLLPALGAAWRALLGAEIASP